MTEPEVVYRDDLDLLDRSPDHHERYGGHIGPNNAKTSVKRPLSAKPEVEMWRRPDVSTQGLRLPIRLPIHYGVYL